MSKESEFIRDNYLKVRGYYFLIHGKGAHRLYARTRSAETVVELKNLGFHTCTEAWDIYRKKIADYDLY